MSKIQDAYRAERARIAAEYDAGRMTGGERMAALEAAYHAREAAWANDPEEQERAADEYYAAEQRARGQW